VPAAVLTDDLLLRAGLDHHPCLLGAHQADVVLDDRASGVLDDRLLVAAARTLEQLGGDVEHQLRAALVTRVGTGLLRGVQGRAQGLLLAAGRRVGSLRRRSRKVTGLGPGGQRRRTLVMQRWRALVVPGTAWQWWRTLVRATW
jgi:hypothetical protein